MPKSTDRLLTARASKASELEELETKDTSTTSSHTLLDDTHPEPLRFSTRRDMNTENSGSPKRVLMSVVIVVVLGVGLVLLVQAFIAGQPSTTDTTPPAETEETPVVKIAGFTMAEFQLADSSAPKSVMNDQYVNSELALGSVNNDLTDVELVSLTQEEYSTFSLFTWELSAGAKGLPATKIKYNSDQIEVSFTGLTVAEGADLVRQIDLDLGNVSKITGEEVDGVLVFTLDLLTTSKYAAFVDGGSKLQLYIKSEAQLMQPATPVVEEPVVEEPVVEPEVPVVTDPDPATPTGDNNYDNTASTSKQFITNSVTGNTILSETYYYVDYGDSFQFSWAMRGEGASYIPNASAEYITDAGKNYIEVKINNLGYDLLHNKGREKAVIGISTASSNLVDVYTKGYADGTATFWVETREKKNFRLHSTQTYGGYQLVSLWLAD